MNNQGKSFSTQYLKQVQDEWLYVLALQERKHLATRDSQGGPASYSFCALGDRQVPRQAA